MEFEVKYPYATQAACLAAISEQGLRNHFACGGRRNNVDRYMIAEWPRKAPKEVDEFARKRVKAEPSVSLDAPVATGKRNGGAMVICREVFAIHNADKNAFVAACVERGIFIGTAKARWSDLVRK